MPSPATSPWPSPPVELPPVEPAEDQPVEADQPLAEPNVLRLAERNKIK